MGLLEAFLIVEVRNELLVRPVIIGLVARYPLIFYDRHHAAMRGVPVHRVMIDMIVDHPAAGVIAPDHDIVAFARPDQHGVRVDRRRQFMPVLEHDLEDVAMDVDRMETRSEEHTSELQSLMRSTYAVFCLKKKK